MRLFIAEKPSVAKAIAGELGIVSRSDGYIQCQSDTVVTWCFGHMLELAEPDAYTADDIPRGKSGKKYWREADLPIIPERWILHPKEDAKKQLAVIGKLLKQADTVVNAGDPDREGQLLVDEVLQHFDCRKPVQRFWVSAQDSVSLQRGLAALKDNRAYAGLADAARGRQRADWLMGMNLSRAYTLAARRSGSATLLTVGRVQTPTLALVVARDRAIEHFQPVNYFRIAAQVEHAQGSFVARWQPSEAQAGLDSENRLLDSAIAQALVNKLSGASGTVLDYQSEARKQAPPLAFSLSDITALASRQFGYSAEQTLQICQSLYETHKLTSYPRTDCAYLPESQHADAPAVLTALKVVNPDLTALIEAADPGRKSPTWNDKKITAHHGIIPTCQQGDTRALSEAEFNLYRLIVRAYIAQFYPEHQYQQTRVTLDIDGERFTASGKVVTHAGWKSVYQESEDEDAGKGKASSESEENGSDSQPLPPMKSGDSVTCVMATKQDAQTRPLPRFTEGTLIRAMENIHRFVDDSEAKKHLRDGDGIGTAATRASIISELKRRSFLETKGKHIQSSALGRSLVDALPEKLKSPLITALFERKLSEIAHAGGELTAFVKQQETFVRAEVEKARQGTVQMAASTANPTAKSLSAQGTGIRHKPARGGSTRRAVGTFRKKP